jgi:hypothetical protein
VLRAEERHQVHAGGHEERVDGAAGLPRSTRFLAHSPREYAGVVGDQPHAPPLHEVQGIREENLDTRSDALAVGTFLSVRVLRRGWSTSHARDDPEQREPAGL